MKSKNLIDKIVGSSGSRTGLALVLTFSFLGPFTPPKEYRGYTNYVNSNCALERNKNSYSRNTNPNYINPHKNNKNQHTYYARLNKSNQKSSHNLPNSYNSKNPEIGIGGRLGYL